MVWFKALMEYKKKKNNPFHLDARAVLIQEVQEFQGRNSNSKICILFT